MGEFPVFGEINNSTILAVMRNELECVKRNNGRQCDRKCEKCDLVLSADTIIATYEHIINMLAAAEDDLR